MTDIVKALKALGKKFNTSQTEPEGDSIAKVIESMTENFNIGAKGDKGDTGATGETGAAGASVTAITLTTTEGSVTGGTATLSNGTSVTITVTPAT